MPSSSACVEQKIVIRRIRAVVDSAQQGWDQERARPLGLIQAATYGTLFLIPLYLQTLRGQLPYRSGAIQAAQSLATLFITPIAGRLSDRFGPKPVALTGVVLFAFALAALSLLNLSIPLLCVAALLIPLGIGNALSGQTTVCAMSNISKHEHKEVANGSTILSCLRATSAPFGVALSSGLVLFWSGSSIRKIASPQATMQAMQNVFLVGACLVAAAAIALALVPKRQKIADADDVLLSAE